MINDPLFSVLIANYNNGKYLQEAIESVLAQTYVNWEIVIVDDDSTDQSRSVYEKYKEDDRIHVYYNEENKGCGYTKNRCVELAKGTICGFLDADDLLLPDALRIHVAAHEHHPDCSCVFSRYYHCDENLEEKTPLRVLVIPEGETYFTHRDYMPEHFTSFKREMYLQTSGIDIMLKAAVDQDLYFKLEEIAPVVVLEDITYLYRRNGNQVSYSDPKKAFVWNLIVRYETCRRRGLDPELYVGADIIKALNEYEAIIASYKQDSENARTSKAYRLGRRLLKVLRPFKKS